MPNNMAAGESPLENGRQEPHEDDNDWSDFTSNSNKLSSAFCFEGEPEPKSLPSKDSGIFTSVSETLRLCFPVESAAEISVSVLCNGEGGRNRTGGTPVVLEESSCLHCGRLNQHSFPYPSWKCSHTEATLLKLLNVRAPGKGKDKQEVSLPVERLLGLFNFHRLAEKNMEFWRSPARWSLDDLGDDSVPEDDRHEKCEQQDVIQPTEEHQPELNEFTDDLEVWSGSESSETDDIFLLFGRRHLERPSSLDECQAAAGLHQLSYEELLDLRDEMSSYVKEYSDVLVDELMVKDEQIREKEIKNVFISSLLTLQSRLREVQSNQGKRKIGPSANKYITTVIPYEEQAGGPKTAELGTLIEIMDAMSGDSATVPSLLTEYILKVLCP